MIESVHSSNERRDLRASSYFLPKPPSPSPQPQHALTCERCEKTQVSRTPLKCFASVSEACASSGSCPPGVRWHHVSAHEHFCHQCVEHYGRGEGRRIWRAQQANGRCSLKELVVRLHLPVWMQCSRDDCRKWRPLDHTARQGQTPLELGSGWHCGLIAMPQLGAHRQLVP